MIQHHLDNAAGSHPKPEAVARAVADALALSGNAGRGSGDGARAAREALERARQGVAEFVGASPGRLAFTLNATDAINGALGSLAPPGARVVTSGIEHGAVLRPLESRARRGELTLARVVPRADGLLDPRDVAEAARGAALVALSLASNVTGLRQPLEDVARLLPEGTALLVDAAQAAGSLALDVRSFGPRAVTCFSGHKALLGPMGCGVITAGDGVALRPWREGGTGDGADRQPTELPASLESGTMPLPAIIGLAAGVAWWNEQGTDSVRRHERAQLDRLVESLRACGAEMPGFLPGERVPLVVFRMPGLLPEETAMLLQSEFGIASRAGLHCAPEAHRHLGTWPDGLVRLSIGPTTTDADIDACCAALEALSAP